MRSIHRRPTPLRFPRAPVRGTAPVRPLSAAVIGLLFSATAVAIGFAPASPLAAQQYTGNYSTTDAAGAPTTLVLRESGGGTVSGSFTRGRLVYRVDARIVDGLVSGTLRGASGELYFEAERTPSDLWLTLWATNALGEPDEEDFEEFGFALDGGGTGSASRPSPGDPLQGRSPLPPRTANPGGEPVGSGNPLAGGNPLSGSVSDPYSGYFTDGNVALELWGGGGQYEGQIVVGGSSYPVRAAGGAGGVQGTFESVDGAWPITAQLQGGVLVLVSGGVRYYLYRDVVGRPGAQYGPGQYGPGQYGRDGQYGPGGVGAPLAGRGGAAGWGGTVLPGFTEQHIDAREWLVYLAGNDVSRLIANAGAGASDPGDRLDVSLCSDRTFSTRAQGRASNAPGRIPPPSAGWWTVVSDGETALLLLEFRDGRIVDFRMHFADRIPYANGSRIGVEPAQSCR